MLQMFVGLITSYGEHLTHMVLLDNGQKEIKCDAEGGSYHAHTFDFIIPPQMLLFLSVGENMLWLLLSPG